MSWIGLRVGVRHLPLVAVEVGDGDEELEQVPVWHQRRERRSGRSLIHAVERVVDPLRHQIAPEGRMLQRSHGHPPDLQLPGKEVGRREESVDVAPLEPEIAEPVEREVVGQRLGQADAVDPSCGGSRDHVDDHARPHSFGVALRHLREQPPVDALTEARRLGTGLRRVEQRRSTDEAVELLRQTVHVDRQRRAAVADQRKAELLHGATVGRLLCGDVGVRRVQRPAFCSTRKTGRSAGNLADRPPRVKRGGAGRSDRPRPTTSATTWAGR